MSDIAALRQLLEQRYPDATALAHQGRPVATGIVGLDEILPEGGLPPGTLTLWHSLGGAMAILRAVCQTVIAGGARAAWIDGAGTFIPEPAAAEGLILVQPTSPVSGLRGAEYLLRSGGLALVVLAGAQPDDTSLVRLTRAAREGGSAFVALARRAATARLRIQSRFHARSYHWTRGPFGDAMPVETVIEIWVRSLGWNTRATVTCPVLPYELRLSLDPGRADRRGSGRGVRR